MLKTRPDESVHCCISSPPYWGLRDYGTAKWEGGDDRCPHNGMLESQLKPGASSQTPESQAHATRARQNGDRSVCRKCGAIRIDNQLGLEKSPEEYVAKIVAGFREVRRVLRKDGTLWLNLGDSYAGSGHGYLSEIKGKQKTNAGTLFMAGRPPADVPSGLKPKDLVGIPWRVAFALQADGWWLRMDIIWAKPNPMPESVTDRPTKSHEYVFLMSKSAKYWYDADAIKEVATGYDGRRDTMMKGSDKYQDGEYLAAGNANSLSVNGRERWKYKNLQEYGQQPNTMHEKRLVGDEYLSPVRNKRSVWTVATQPFKEAHFATFPEDLVKPCILAGCPEGGTVLDPFAGTCTVGLVCARLNRNFVGIDLNPEYLKMRQKQIDAVTAQERLAI